MLLLPILLRKKIFPQHPTSLPKICSDTYTAKNSSDCFNKQASLDDNVDGKILRILDDWLNLFNGSEKTSQGIKEQVNESSK